MMSQFSRFFVIRDKNICHIRRNGIMMHKNTSFKFISGFLMVALLLVLSTNFVVIQGNAITPRWVSIFSIDLCMSFDGSDGNVSGVAIKQSTATSIEGTVTLYELVDDEWIYIDEWYNSKSRGTLGVSGDFVCESGVTYKAVFVVTAYTDSTPESETVEYIEQCP